MLFIWYDCIQITMKLKNNKDNSSLLEEKCKNFKSFSNFFAMFPIEEQTESWTRIQMNSIVKKIIWLHEIKKKKWT